MMQSNYETGWGDKQNYISFLMADPKLLPTIPGIVMGILYYRQTNTCLENPNTSISR